MNQLINLRQLLIGMTKLNSICISSLMHIFGLRVEGEGDDKG